MRGFGSGGAHLVACNAEGTSAEAKEEEADQRQHAQVRELAAGPVGKRYLRSRGDGRSSQEAMGLHVPLARRYPEAVARLTPMLGRALAAARTTRQALVHLAVQHELRVQPPENAGRRSSSRQIATIWGYTSFQKASFHPVFPFPKPRRSGFPIFPGSILRPRFVWGWFG